MHTHTQHIWKSVLMERICNRADQTSHLGSVCLEEILRCDSEEAGVILLFTVKLQLAVNSSETNLHNCRCWKRRRWAVKRDIHLAVLHTVWPEGCMCEFERRATSAYLVWDRTCWFHCTEHSTAVCSKHEQASHRVKYQFKRLPRSHIQYKQILMN